MAVLDFISVMPSSLGTGTNNIYNATIGAAGNSGKIVTGFDMIIRVAISAACTIRFGAQGTITAAGATDLLLPIAGEYRFDMGHQNDAIWIFSTPGATVTVTQIQKN